MGQRVPLVSGMIVLRSCYSVENFPLSFMHINEMLIGSVQNGHGLLSFLFVNILKL